MDPGYLSGLAVFSGSVVGALTSFLSAWLTQDHEAHLRRASENKLRRQRLYAQFMEEASKLYADALARGEAEVPALVSAYALISQMRMTSHTAVVESAEAVIQTILTTYSRPNSTLTQLQNLLLSREFIDPLRAFGEVCRSELQDTFSRQTPRLWRRLWPSAARARALTAWSIKETRT